MAKRRAHGEGALYQRKSDGRWVGALPAAASPTGKRIVVYGATKAEALDKPDRKKAEAREGSLAAPNKITVEQLMAEFLESVHVSGRAQGTYDTYEAASRLYIVPHLGHYRVADLKPSHLTRFYATVLQRGRRVPRGPRAKGAGLHPTTVAVLHRALHQALRLAVRWRYVGRNVAGDVAAPQTRVEEAATLSEDEVRAFLADAAARQDRYLAAWHVAADTGARRGELVALRWDDLILDRSRPLLFVRRRLANVTIGAPQFRDLKTKRSQRPITLSPTTVNVLAAHRERQEALRRSDPQWKDYGLIFPARHGRACPGVLLYDYFKRAAAKAHLPEGVRLHSLRHTMATLLLAKGANVDTVSRRLGHASASITLGIYAHAIPSSEEAAAELMERILAPAPPTQPVLPPVDLDAQRRQRRA